MFQGYDSGSTRSASPFQVTIDKALFISDSLAIIEADVLNEDYLARKPPTKNEDKDNAASKRAACVNSSLHMIDLITGSFCIVPLYSTFLPDPVPSGAHDHAIAEYDVTFLVLNLMCD